MKYQLVVQMPCESMEEYDSIIELETQLIDSIGAVATVDGHDVGGGTMNLFFFTNDPTGAFDQIKPALECIAPLDQVVAASRQVDQDFYQVIHPHDYSGDFSVL